MLVIEAEAMGMCFGVRDALAVMRNLERPAEVTVFGQLVHNPAVMRELAERGFALMEEGRRGVERVQTQAVLITAHGVSDRQRAELVAQGKRVVDTTCPLVKKAHQAAVRLARAGFFVLVVGKKGHVEVEGLTGDLAAGRFEVVESVAGVKRWEGEKRIGVVAQTTSVEREVRGIVERVRELNGESEVRFVNTVCMPTRDRQRALERLLEQVDVLVVVGGHGSNNTRQLVGRAREAGVRTVHVEAAGEVEEGMFGAGEIVGLTAGTSTLAETIGDVKGRLESFHGGVMREAETSEVCNAK